MILGDDELGLYSIGRCSMRSQGESAGNLEPRMGTSTGSTFFVRSSIDPRLAAMFAALDRRTLLLAPHEDKSQ
jgi:hypothetical protein